MTFKTDCCGTAYMQWNRADYYTLTFRISDAETREAEGDLQGAFDLFLALSSYRDAADRAQTLADQLGIEIKSGDDLY